MQTYVPETGGGGGGGGGGALRASVNCQLSVVDRFFDVGGSSAVYMMYRVSCKLW